MPSANHDTDGQSSDHGRTKSRHHPCPHRHKPVLPPSPAFLVSGQFLDHLVVVIVPKRCWKFVRLSHLWKQLSQVFEKLPTRRTRLQMAFDPDPFALRTIAVVVQYQIFFEILASSSQCVALFLHDLLPKRIPSGSVSVPPPPDEGRRELFLPWFSSPWQCPESITLDDCATRMPSVAYWASPPESDPLAVWPLPQSLLHPAKKSRRLVQQFPQCLLFPFQAAPK